MKIVGIDNGISGSVCIYDTDTEVVQLYPGTDYTFKARNYQKEESYITRVDPLRFLAISQALPKDAKIVIERPYTGKPFSTAVSAARCLEAMLFAFDVHGLEYEFIDSKEWQSHYFPKHRGEALKVEATIFAENMFPELDWEQLKCDGDAVMIMLYAKQKYFVKK